MLGPNSVLEKECVADGALTKFRIVKKGTNEDDLAPATAVTESLMGVVQHDAADTERARLMVIGISKVEFGGAVVQGEMLTTDANGKAVKATRHTHLENTNATYLQNETTAVGSDVRVIGMAMSNGADGDIGTVLLMPGMV